MLSTLQLCCCFYRETRLCDGTEQHLYIRHVSQVLQQLMQQVIAVRRNGLQMFQEQLYKWKCDQLCTRKVLTCHFKRCDS